MLWPSVWVCSVARDLCPLSCVLILPAVRVAGVALVVALLRLGVASPFVLALGAVVCVALVPAAWAALVAVAGVAAVVSWFAHAAGVLLAGAVPRGLLLPVLLRCCSSVCTFARGTLRPFWAVLAAVWARYACSRSSLLFMCSSSTARR